MNEKYLILAINPGSTSTKIALFENDAEIFSETIEHAADDLKGYADIQDQLEYRREMVEKAMEARGYSTMAVDVFAGRGGGILSVSGGTYEVTELLVEHASIGMTGQHPAQLASQICKQFADQYGGRGFHRQSAGC